MLEEASRRDRRQQLLAASDSHRGMFTEQESDNQRSVAPLRTLSYKFEPEPELEPEPEPEPEVGLALHKRPEQEPVPPLASEIRDSDAIAMPPLSPPLRDPPRLPIRPAPGTVGQGVSPRRRAGTPVRDGHGPELGAAVLLGLGRVVALYCRSSTSYQIC